ncbi:hypothetical protein [Pontiella desulfatans]|nr:hypothetical protein [Pontiella desulfatans]
MTDKKDPALAGAESHTRTQEEHIMIDATLQAFDVAAEEARVASN